MMTYSKWIAVPLLLTLNEPGAVEVYRWVDEEGGVHYGDRPGGKSRSVAPAQAQLDAAFEARNALL